MTQFILYFVRMTPSGVVQFSVALHSYPVQLTGINIVSRVVLACSSFSNSFIFLLFPLENISQCPSAPMAFGLSKYTI